MAKEAKFPTSSDMTRSVLSFLTPTELSTIPTVNKDWKAITDGEQGNVLWSAFLDAKSAFKSNGKRTYQEMMHERLPPYYPKNWDDCVQTLDCPDVYEHPEKLLTQYANPLAYLAFETVYPLTQDEFAYFSPIYHTQDKRFKQIIEPLAVEHPKTPGAILENLASKDHIESIYYLAKLQSHEYKAACNYIKILNKDPFHTNALYELGYLIEKKLITVHLSTPILNNIHPAMQPSFLYRRALQIEATHPDALCRLAGQIATKETKALSTDFPELTPAEIPEDPSLQALHLYLKAVKKHPHHVNALRDLFKHINNHQLDPTVLDIPALQKSSSEDTLLKWEKKFFDNALPRSNFERAYREWKDRLQRLSFIVARMGDDFTFQKLKTEYPRIFAKIRTLADLPYDEQTKMVHAFHGLRVDSDFNVKELCRIMRRYWDIQDSKEQEALERLFNLPHTRTKEGLIFQFGEAKDRSAITTAVETAEDEHYPIRNHLVFGIICGACVMTGPIVGYQYLKINNYPEWALALALFGIIMAIIPTLLTGVPIWRDWDKKNDAFQDDRILENINSQPKHPHPPSALAC